MTDNVSIRQVEDSLFEILVDPSKSCLSLRYALKDVTLEKNFCKEIPVWYTLEDGCPDLLGVPDEANECFIEGANLTYAVGTLQITVHVTPRGRLVPFVSGASLGDALVFDRKKVLAAWERGIIRYNREVLMRS